MLFLINLTAKYKTNLRHYLGNNLQEIYLQSNKQYQAEFLLFAWKINTVTINTIKTITMPIISHFIYTIIL